MSERPEGAEIFSPRLETLAAEIIRGREPNAGRFCANCYSPMTSEATTCSHCGRPLASTGAVDKIPREVLIMIRAKHGREARIVRSIAYGGLLLAMIGASAGLIFISGNWGIAAFILILIGGYFLSAVLANSVGDAWGYRNGQKGLVQAWEDYVAQRDVQQPEAVSTSEPAGA